MYLVCFACSGQDEESDTDDEHWAASRQKERDAVDVVTSKQSHLIIHQAKASMRPA